MLCDRNTACRRYDGRCRRDVEGVQTVTPGTTGVEQWALDLRANGFAMLTKGARRSGDLVDRLALHPESHHERRDLSARGLPGEDGIHRGLDVTRGQVTPRDDLPDRVRDHDTLPAESVDSQLRISS